MTNRIYRILREEEWNSVRGTLEDSLQKDNYGISRQAGNKLYEATFAQYIEERKKLRKIYFNHLLPDKRKKLLIAEQNKTIEVLIDKMKRLNFIGVEVALRIKSGET